MEPATTWLSEAPMPTAVLMAPRVRLNRPEPRVRSAITRTETTPNMPAATPSRDLDCHQCDRVGGQRVENGSNRKRSEGHEQQRLSTPGPRFPTRPGRKQRDDKLRRHHARRHKHHRVPTLTLGQHLAQQRQHRGVRKVKHHRADEKHDQWTILQAAPRRFRRVSRVLVAFLCAPRARS
jgi:hypothetical protein